MQDFKITGAPNHELMRTPAANRVGELAAQNDLLLAHFEYRKQLEPPEHWLPENRPDLGTIAAWQNGILPESKYQGFRNDLILGSFHPGHRAKWTAHELCHGLVGYAWRSDATPFFHALAAQLSELLPVALFYFFDEAFLRRCEIHEGAGPLFGNYCPACEQSASLGPLQQDANSERWHKQGRAFVDRELAAVNKAKRLGRPVSSPWANLDLSSDGLAYASAHQKRLASPQFHQYVDLFVTDEQGMLTSLEALEARILAVMEAITTGTALEPWRHDHYTWKRQDLGWRILEVSSECEAEVADQLTTLAEKMSRVTTEEELQVAIEAYESLHEEYYLPDPADLLAVGYDLPKGYGRSQDQINAGIQSACPRTWQQLEERGEAARNELVTNFIKEDTLSREPLGKRFNQWLKDNDTEELAAMAALETAITHGPAPDATAISLGSTSRDGNYRLAADVQLIKTTAAALAQLGMGADEPAPWLALRRVVGGELDILNLDGETAALLLRLQAGSPLEDLNPDVRETLLANRLIVPTAWSLTWG